MRVNEIMTSHMMTYVNHGDTEITENAQRIARVCSDEREEPGLYSCFSVPNVLRASVCLGG